MVATAKKTVKRAARQKKQLSPLEKVKAWLANVWRGITTRRKNFLARRPHRSFRRTRRRDYTRSLVAPGYISFTVEVGRMLRTHWRLFLLLTLVYAAIMVLLGAITSQDVYATITELFSGAGADVAEGGIGAFAEAALVTLATFASGGSNLTAEQSVYLGFTLMFSWLATVWLLRELLLGRRPKLRDGLYNSGAPILSTVGVLVVMAIQAIPVGIVMLAYAALSAIGFIDDGFGAMLFWLFASVVVAMVLYWLTSTLLALVVVTIPGMYPLRAVRVAGDLVVGRRLRILLRLLWGALLAAITWSLLLIVSVLLDNLLRAALPNLSGFSAVPYISAVASAAAMVWFATYVYLFYRKVVDDDAKPA